MSEYVEVYDIHPDYKDGVCRECGKELANRIHKDVQRGVEPVETVCKDCTDVHGHYMEADATVRL